MSRPEFSRADRRIAHLESEVRRLRRAVRRTKPRASVGEDFVVPLVWLASCGVAGLAITKVVRKLRKSA